LTGSIKTEESRSRLPWAKKGHPVSKITRARRAKGMAHVVQHLRSTPSTVKKIRIKFNLKVKYLSKDVIEKINFLC
jgi:hypothetical protein